jgi:hypothetical protein
VSSNDPAKAVPPNDKNNDKAQTTVSFRKFNAASP